MLPLNRRVKRGWMNLEVVEMIQETPDTRTLILVDQEERTRPFDYTPGQYLTFRFDDLAAKPVVRSYTMSSSPCQGEVIGVTVKEVEQGFVSRYLCREVEVGAVLRARGPIGKFCYEPAQDRKNLAMIAAGSGVTPFISIMREFAPQLGQPGAPAALSLLVSYRSRADIICAQELQALAAFANVKIFISLSRETLPGFWTGRISPDLLQRAFGATLHEWTYMLCGPEAMMETAQAYLRSQALPEQQIKRESFAS